MSEVEYPATYVYKSFDSTSQVYDIWEFLLNPFYSQVYTSASFDEGPYASSNVTTVVGNKPGFLTGQNRILGVIFYLIVLTVVVSLSWSESRAGYSGWPGS